MCQAGQSSTREEHPAHVICEHELKTCYAELTSSCCFLHSTYTETYSQDPVPVLLPEIGAYRQLLFLEASVR